MVDVDVKFMHRFAQVSTIFQSSVRSASIPRFLCYIERFCGLSSNETHVTDISAQTTRWYIETELNFQLVPSTWNSEDTFVLLAFLVFVVAKFSSRTTRSFDHALFEEQFENDTCNNTSR